MNLIIRKEQPDDYPIVFDLVELAFRTMPYADGDEQFMVEALRKNKAFIRELSLVAEVDDALVGQIMFTPMQVVNEDKVFNSLILGPLSVHPDYQNRGIGTKLVVEGHRIAGELGFSSCFVVGHPEYYPRFGYIPTIQWGIPPIHGAPPEACMAVEFVPGAMKGVSGTMKLLPEFGTD